MNLKFKLKKMSSINSNSIDIIKLYQEGFSKYIQDFPIEEDQLYSNHKSIISQIKSELDINTFPSSVQKNIETEYSKISEQNEQMYLALLTTHLDDEFDFINGKLIGEKYKNIDEYISDLKLFQEKIKGAENECPKGPNMNLYINKYILEQILNDYDIIFSKAMNEFNKQISEKENEINEINEEIKKAQNECQNLTNNIKQKESEINQIESDKNYIIKQTTSNADKISKNLKIKTDMINKLNQEIENIEAKNNQVLSELKQKIINAEQNKLQKEKTNTELKNNFEQSKIELQTKIDLLQKQIQNMNQTRATMLKSLLVNELVPNSQNFDTKKFEDQLLNLNKKIEKLQNKNNELTMELLEKDKILENEKNKSVNLVNEYEKKLKSVNDDHNYMEEKAAEIQAEENNNLEELKKNYEFQISELKANFSKDELIIKTNIEKLKNLIEKTKSEINSLKLEYEKSSAKLEQLKSQNIKDKTDYDNYVKILEENHKRIMSQYDEGVKENNNLKSQQKADIISLNGETEKKIVAFAKDNEKINGEITRKNLEYNALINELNEKLNNLENEIPSLQLEEENLSKMINDIYQQKDNINNEYETEIEQIKAEHEKELEELKAQCVSDLENNKITLQNNLIFAKKECEEQKEELMQKMQENIELNKKNEEELINMYNEKIKILEQVKDEKIDDLNNDINDVNNMHQEYAEQTEDELQNINEQINILDNEMNDTKNILTTIQSDHDALIKKRKMEFKEERNKLRQILEDLLKKYNQTFINFNLEQKDNSILLDQVNYRNEKIDKKKQNLENLKAQKNEEINDLNTQIKNLNKDLLNSKNDFNQKIALKDQEIEYTQSQIEEKQKELDDFKNTYEDRISQCEQELINEYSNIISELNNEKNELEINLNNKKSELKELEYNYNNQISLLQKEKEVLTEKLNTVTSQIDEVKKNLDEEKNRNLIQIDNIKGDNDNKNSQLLKENQALRNKLKELENDFNELGEVYEKDKTLWSNKYNHLLDDKNNIENELINFKNKYNSNIDDLNTKLQSDRIHLQQIYNDAIIKRDEKFNTQINKANKYFASKFEYINNLNQALTIKNNELIQTLNEYETKYNTKDKESQLAVLLQSITRYKKDINELNNTKDKDIEELKGKLIEEKRNFSNKIILAQSKLRNYEIKRSNFSASALKQNYNSEKNMDEQDVIITRLKNEIATLEKANFRLKIEKRDNLKDNKSLKRRNSRENNLMFVPKARVTTTAKDKKLSGIMNIGNNLQFDIVSTQKKNLLDKFNKQKSENEEYNSIGMGSNNSGSVILNASYIEDGSNKK